MNWMRAVLACAKLVYSGPPLLAQEENEPVPPVYVPDGQRDDAASDPPVSCQGQECLSPADNPVEECKGQGCAPEPTDEPE